jgi:hypothetical protein
MKDDSRLIAKENKELREQLSKAQDLLLKQQTMMETMEKQIQKLVLQAPPTSPTSIIDNSLCSSKDLLVRSPLIAPCRKKSLSSQEQALLASILAACHHGNDEVVHDDLPKLVSMGDDTLSCDDPTRRISSITIPDALVSNKSGAKTSPNKSRQPFRKRRPTPLPLTPERTSFDDDDNEEGTESQSSGVDSVVADNESEEPLGEEEGLPTSDIPSIPANDHHPPTETPITELSTTNDEDDQSDMPGLVSMQSSVMSRRFCTANVSSKNNASSRNSRNHARRVLARRPTPLPSTPERTNLFSDGEWDSNGDSTDTDEEDFPSECQNNDDDSWKQKDVRKSTIPKTDEQAMSDAYLLAAMSQLASSELPPRLPPYSCASQEQRKSLANQHASQGKKELREGPPSSPRSPQTATITRRTILANAVKGLPREGSIEEHSDDDITVYPSPAKELGRTMEVLKHQVLDSKNERGLYTGSIDRKSHLPDGYGIMKYRQGQKYTGDWEKGRWHGHGVLIMKSGDAYEGFFVNHEKHGQGESRFIDGRVFDGRFHLDEMREGKLTFTDNSYYHGLMKNGKRHDFGMYVFSDGSYYEGQWEHDQIHGRGRVEWVDGSSYNGDWHYGIQHGIGTELGGDGKVRYQGQFYNNRPIYQAKRTSARSARTA